jgi:hypothetical protein
MTVVGRYSCRISCRSSKLLVDIIGVSIDLGYPLCVGVLRDLVASLKLDVFVVLEHLLDLVSELIFKRMEVVLIELLTFDELFKFLDDCSMDPHFLLSCIICNSSKNFEFVFGKELVD